MRSTELVVAAEYCFPIEKLVDDLVDHILEQKSESEKMIQIFLPREIDLSYVASRFIISIIDGGRRGAISLFHEIVIYLGSYHFVYSLDERYECAKIYPSINRYLTRMIFEDDKCERAEVSGYPKIEADLEITIILNDLKPKVIELPWYRKDIYINQEKKERGGR